MQLTDSHIHLYAAELASNNERLMQDALLKQVQRFFLPNIDSTTMQLMFDVCNRYPAYCFPMLGLHPCSVKENFREELALIRMRAEQEKIFAVGEMGIDLYWDKSYIKEQEEAFVTQMQWAHEWKLPLVIHSREATDVCIRLVEENQQWKPRGIFHCFSGNADQALKIISLGFYLGIGGVLTFKNAGLAEVIEQIDLRYIVLETDAPYLAPAPHRGKTNEPAFIYLVAEKLAAIKNKSVDEVAAITTANSKTIFGI